jgi:hypothetical protein
VHAAGRPVLVRSVLLCWQQCAAGTDTLIARPSTAMNTRCANDTEDRQGLSGAELGYSAIPR